METLEQLKEKMSALELYLNIMALEFGYRSHERGESLLEAISKFKEIIKPFAAEKVKP
jgi:hypothetical protein